MRAHMKERQTGYIQSVAKNKNGNDDLIITITNTNIEWEGMKELSDTKQKVGIWSDENGGR